ncbi:MAG: hypothetical protein AAB804_01840 [Patescibacteria group bacterium]
MLSFFPDILFLAPFSVFFFRVALAFTLAYSAWRHFSSDADTSKRTLGALEIAAAVAIGVGAWTQPAALGASMILIAELALPRLRAVAFGTALLALVMAISLVVTGPGALSFDLPL